MPKKITNHIICFAVSAVLFITVLFNIKPFVSGEIGTIFKQKVIPSPFIKLEEYLKNDNEFSRVLYIPARVRWSSSSLIHPIVSLLELDPDDTWRKEVEMCFGSSFFNNDVKINREQTNCFLEYLKIASIKFIVVPLSDHVSKDDIYNNYSINGHQSPYNYIRWLQNLNIGEQISISDSLFVLKVQQHASNIQLKHSKESVGVPITNVYPTTPWGFSFKINDLSIYDKLYVSERFNKNIVMTVKNDYDENISIEPHYDEVGGFLYYDLPVGRIGCRDDPTRMCGDANLSFRGNAFLDVSYKLTLILLAAIFICALII